MIPTKKKVESFTFSRSILLTLLAVSAALLEKRFFRAFEVSEIGDLGSGFAYARFDEKREKADGMFILTDNR